MTNFNKELSALLTKIVELSNSKLKILECDDESFKSQKCELNEFLSAYTNTYSKKKASDTSNQLTFLMIITMTLNTKLATKLQELFFKYIDEFGTKGKKEEKSDCQNQNLELEVDVRVCPKPIDEKKIHNFGLYYNQEKTELYFMRRQEDAWKQAETKLLKKGFKVFAIWKNVPMGIDIGNSLKCHLLENYPKIEVHYNTISLKKRKNINEKYSQIIEKYLDKVISLDSNAKKV